MAEVSKELARGSEITLINGNTIRIIFSLYTLAVIEDELGSLDAIDKVFTSGTSGKLVRTLGKLLANSIVDERFTEDEILRQIALEDVGTVFGQVQKGLTEGFQPPQATPVTAPTATDQSPSLGADCSTSGASRSDSGVKIFGNAT